MTPNQQHVINTAIKLIGEINKKPDADGNHSPMPEAVVEELVKVGANALIDLNRIADAMEVIAQALAMMAVQQGASAGKSPIIKPPGM